jgi:8-oxo-dGTP diphosphatase
MRGDSILLVRYFDNAGWSYLVGPGGALKESENAVDAIIRETIEETGVTVRPVKLLWIEDLQCKRFKMSKTWMLCEVVSGEVTRTLGAIDEGITHAGWFTRSQLAGETVYPPPVMEQDWSRFAMDGWQAVCLPSRKAEF